MAVIPLLAMVRKDLQLFFSDRRSVIVSFVVPIAIAAFFGSIFSGPSNNSEPAKISIAVVDHDHAIGQPLGFLHVMRRVEERLAAPLEGLEVVEDRVAALRIDADGRLVEQQDIGVVENPGGEIEAPLHAAAEVLDAIADAIAEADEIDRRGDRGVERAAGQAEQRAEEPQVVARRQLVV